MSKDNSVQSIKRFYISFVVTTSIASMLILWLYSILISPSGEIETNPGSK